MGPNSPEVQPEELWLHPAMTYVGNKFGVPTIDLHSYMRSIDSIGFLWWDLVHPTSYGHERLADYLAAAIHDLGLLPGTADDPAPSVYH